MTTAERIREAREAHNLTQGELAKMLGLSGKSSICKIETSGDKVTLKTVKKVSDALGVSIPYLMGWGEDDSLPSDEPAYNLLELTGDKPLMKALETYHSLSDEQKKHVIDTIYLLGKQG